MIVPALLTDKKDKFLTMLEVCAGFADYIQVDIMDGLFVPSKSIDASALKGVKFSLKCEVHLMVADPLIWLDTFRQLGAEKVIYHFEIKADHPALIAKIREKGFKVGLAVNPPTRFEEFSFLLKDIDSLLFMSVNPGFYGAPFIPEVLAKIKQFRADYPNVEIGIDGGIKLSNARMVKDSGVDYLCVGSAIFESADPQNAYNEFVRVSNG